MEKNEAGEIEKNSRSIKEKKIRNLTNLYYSRKDIQKAIFEFSLNREVVPRYFEGFGKRPDSLQYPQDVFELVKKGATSFHCSQELWKEPLSLSTDMNSKQINELRTGWDLLLDIDSKYLDYSKILTEIIINVLKFYGVKNIGLKFSGSKGFHIIVPWNSFPEEINSIKISEMFPEYPRIITQFIMNASKNELVEKISSFVKPNKYVKDFEAPKEVMPDLILVSSRHLFRMPYSLHEKTSLSSVVLSFDELKDFQPKNADPLKIKIKNFVPESKKGEASELLREALDWYKDKNPEKKLSKQDFSESEKFSPLQIKDISEEKFPPSIKEILKGLKDGKKRALFILLNFFRSIGMEKNEVEKKISEWNEKNNPPLNEVYIKTQIIWSYRNKIAPPPNYDKDYYRGIGIIPTEEEMKYKNPLNYVAKKHYQKTEEKKPAKKQNK